MREFRPASAQGLLIPSPFLIDRWKLTCFEGICSACGNWWERVSPALYLPSKPLPPPPILPTSPASLSGWGRGGVQRY